MTVVVALGGNALLRPGERGTAAEQRANLRDVCEALRPLLGDDPLVITHGNGPQVGNELLRHERAADEAPPLPLYLAVAQTQAEIGALIESELAPVAGRAVACLLTHVVVAEDDPAFAEPTKPVGPFYDESRARELESERAQRVPGRRMKQRGALLPSTQRHLGAHPLAIDQLAGPDFRALSGGQLREVEARVETYRHRGRCDPSTSGRERVCVDRQPVRAEEFRKVSLFR